MSETITVAMKDQRDISMVTTEIRTLHRQAQRMILGYAIEIGRRLCEAKEMLAHGQWGDWLKTEVEFSQSTAQNFMRIFEEYGDSQTSLFGDAKSQTLGNLPYTHALKLLAVPADEREQFAEEHRVDELSSRELEKLIRERDEAKRGEEGAVEELTETREKLEKAEYRLEELEEKTSLAEKAREEAEARLAEAEEEWQGQVDKAKAEAERLLQEAAKAAESAKKAKEKLKALQENPEISEEVMTKLREEAAEEAEKKMCRAKAEAEAQVAAAEKAAMQAQMRAEAAEKKLRTADAETAAFKARFVDIQRAFATLREMRQDVAANDEEKAEKMARAVRALLEQEAGLWE